MPTHKSTTKNFSAATALTDTKKFQVKAAMESAHLSAVQTKIGFQEDVSASQDSILSTTSAPNAQQVKSMTSIKEFAEFNAEQINCTTSTVENATVLRVTTSSKELALSACQEKPTIPIPKPATLFHALDLMNSTVISHSSAFASHNMSELMEYAPTVLLDTTSIAIQGNAFASLDTRQLEDSVNQSALQIRPTPMENANATMDFLFKMVNA
jgi:hypothetical protein